jgi:diguanylate cyclase (GGDEF)-like protein
MTDINVILAASEPSVQIALRQALEKEGFCVKLCDTGLRALDELAAHGADCLISATQLEDLNGYQLSSLIKSNERTHRLPIILLASEATNEEIKEPTKENTFWSRAALADMIYPLDQTEEKADEIASELKKLTEKSKSLGWKGSLAKSLIMSSQDLSAPTNQLSYSRLLDNLLIERLVTRLTSNLATLVEPKQNFAPIYFSAIKQVFNPSLLGIVIASPEKSFASYKVTEGLSQESFEQLSTKVSKQLLDGSLLNTEVIGELKTNGNVINEYEVLPISTDKGQGVLVFGSTQKATFDSNARTFMTQLQTHMLPIVQLLLSNQAQELEEEQDSLKTSTDPLTGLYNSEFLTGFLQQQLLFSYRQRLAVGMAIVDIDNLARVNEEFGFDIGNSVLTGIANRLVTITRSSDLIARFGGDEFAIVLPNTDINGVKVLGEKVRLEVEQMNFAPEPGQKGPKVTVSIGCSIFNMEDLNPEILLRDAQLALQEAKEAGQNKVTALSA